MTSPPSPPKLHRRRVVVTVAVLAVGLCWWIWPRGDSRFVGRWTLQGPGDKQPTDDIEFRHSGFALAHDVETAEPLYFMRWKVDGDRLTLGETESPGRLVEELASLWDRFGNFPLVTNEQVAFTIVAVGPDEILLRGSGSSDQSRLVRKK